MKKILLPLVLLVVVMSLTAATAPRVGRSTIVTLEKGLDDRISRLWDDNPYLLLGSTRGVYLENYGAVFTAEVNLVPNPTSLMHANVTKDEVAKARQKKLDRIPQLKKAMRDALVACAAAMDTVPADEQITIVTFLSHYPWEDMNGVPSQLSLQAPRKKLVDAQHAGPAALEALVRINEN